MPLHIAGDPAAVRAGAEGIRRAGAQARDALARIESAHGRAGARWRGQAHDAFAQVALETYARVQAVAGLVDAAAPLDVYADALAAAQAQWDANMPNATHGYGTTAYEPAVAALTAARNAAREANERCAAEIERIAAKAADALVGAQDVRFAASQTAGAAGGLAGAYLSYITTNARQWGANPTADRAATLGSRLGRVGNWGGGILTGGAQLLKDADNPRFSTAERIGRGVTQGATVGGAAFLGAAIGTAIVPGAGTAVGALAGAVVGFVAGYGGATLADEYNDGLVDGGGEIADDVADWTGEQYDAVRSW